MEEASGVDKESDEGASTVKVDGMGEIVLAFPLGEQDGKDGGGTRT